MADKEGHLSTWTYQSSIFFLTNQFYVSLDVGFVCEVLVATIVLPNMEVLVATIVLPNMIKGQVQLPTYFLVVFFWFIVEYKILYKKEMVTMM